MENNLTWFEPLPEPIEAPEQQQADPEVSARMVMKAALIETTNSRGWIYVAKFAETVVRDLEKKSIEEEDDTKANGLRRDARGARKFKDELFRRLALASNVDPANGFVEVVMD